MHAVSAVDGKGLWKMPPQKKLCEGQPVCSAGQGGALTSIPGAVLNSGLDGGLRAYSAKDGSVVWLFDTNREFKTVRSEEHTSELQSQSNLVCRLLLEK